MTHEEYVKLVLDVFNNENGIKLIKHIREQLHESLREHEYGVHSSAETNPRGLDMHMSKLNLINAFDYIVNNAEEALGVNIDKINETLEKEVNDDPRR